MPPFTPSVTTIKRIHREVADLKKEDLGPIALSPSDESLFLWRAKLPGPEGSVYEGGIFHVDISLGHDYPFSAPKMTFKTRIYHMNISDRGGICIDILKHNWSPALSLFKVILSLSSLLTDPNPKDPLVPSIATEYVRNRAQHDRTARHWTSLYAKPPSSVKLSPAAATSSSSSSTQVKSKASPLLESRTSSHAPSETIVIEDSDEEAATRSMAARPKRKRGEEPTNIDLTGDNDDGGLGRRRRRRAVTDAGSSGGTDVIIIDD